LNSPYSQLLQELLNEIDLCVQNNLSDAKKFEGCFWTAVKCYGKLARGIVNAGFANTAEEIEFFKKTKPKFTAFIEFFVISTEALWFINSESICLAGFWKEEMNKYTRFRERHHSFIEYLEKGESGMDHHYFLQRKTDADSSFQSVMFEESLEMHSPKDWLVRSYLAHKMYFRFAQQKLATVIKAEKQAANEGQGTESPRMTASFSHTLLQYLEESGLN
jgi:hypothetical protein